MRGSTALVSDMEGVLDIEGVLNTESTEREVPLYWCPGYRGCPEYREYRARGSTVLVSWI